MSFPLPPEFERAVLDRVASGQYASPDDVLAAALRALEQGEAELYPARNEVPEHGQVLAGEGDQRDEALTDDEARELFRMDAADDETFETALEAIRWRCGLPLRPSDRKFVDDEVKSGRYATPNDVIESALALLRRAEGSEDDRELADLRRQIDSAFEDDELIPGEEVEARTGVRLYAPELQEFIERKVGAGEYGSVMEVVVAGLKLLKEEDDDLRREIARSRDRPTTPGDVAFARLRESRKAASG